MKVQEAYFGQKKTFSYLLDMYLFPVQTRLSSLTVMVVPQESKLKLNRALEPSVAAGLQEVPRRLVLLGLVGGMERVMSVTTTILPSGRQTEYAHINGQNVT